MAKRVSRQSEANEMLDVILFAMQQGVIITFAPFFEGDIKLRFVSECPSGRCYAMDRILSRYVLGEETATVLRVFLDYFIEYCKRQEEKRRDEE